MRKLFTQTTIIIFTLLLTFSAHATCKANLIGTVQCGKGQCKVNSIDSVKCSKARGGGAAVNSIGTVKCLGGCESGSQFMCVGGK